MARYRHATAYYGVLSEPLSSYGLNDERIAGIAIHQEAIIKANKITDWTTNLHMQKKIKRQLDNHFYEVEGEANMEFDINQLDAMIDQLLEIAKA